MSGPAPKVFSIPSGVSFADALAAGLLEEASGDPLSLARMTLLLPNRRAVRAVGEAFLRVSDGQATLLPRLFPLGDLDAEELALGGDEALFPGLELTFDPVLSGPRRDFLLVRLIEPWARRRGFPLGPASLLPLARELALLIDEAETAEIDWDRLEDLVPAELAEHWTETRDFLSIVTEHWSAIEAEEGAIGPARRRRLLLEAQADQWRRQPPAHPVVAAGSTGSIPAVARLLAAVARLPQGRVVLPGLRAERDGALWDAVRDDPGHPQHGLAQLLAALELEPKSVSLWPGARESGGLAARGELVSIAMRPAAATDSWRQLAQGAEDKRQQAWREGLAGLSWYDCAGPREEAALVALLLRETLETPGKTAALVTPDRALARQVASELARWQIAIDDSAGTPLLETPPLVFLRLLAACLAEDLAPAALMALCKHPLAAAGLAPGRFRSGARALELAVLRGAAPLPGWDGLRQAVGKARAEDDGRDWEGIAAFVERLARRLSPLAASFAGGRAALSEVLEGLLKAGEALAESDAESGASRLWAGEAGEAAARALDDIREAAGLMLGIGLQDLPQLLDTLLAGQVVRPRYGRHPRLFIWGPLEARLQHADRMILGGLNEESWPQQPEPGPWLSRAMRQRLGLPSPERRIGQAAHDLVQAMGAQEVVLTRAKKKEGAPTIPSRWLLRLEALCHGLDLDAALQRRRAEAETWPQLLDRPASVQRLERPAPRPPLVARPRRFSVTEIETWLRNPYGLYAKRILGLRALDPLGEEIGAADRGNAIHAILERFVQAYPKALPDDAAEVLERFCQAVFEEEAVPPEVRLLWQPRLSRLLGWFLRTERERRPNLTEVLVEERGEIALQRPGGAVRLSAKADRLEATGAGGLAIVDYKSGQLASRRDQALGLAPQLPLEGLIAQQGGFASLGPRKVEALMLWQLSGGATAGKIASLGKTADDTEAMIAKAAEHFAALVDHFDREESVYAAHPRQAFRPRFDDYEHLARLGEWSATGQDET